MAIKKYQPERTDLLINTDWGTEKSALSEEEAKQKGMILYMERWVTIEEQKLLRQQKIAYQGIFITTVGMLILGFLCIILIITLLNLA